MASNPLLVGITGGIGAGKSIICKIFQCLGVPVYQADDRARWLMTHDTSLISEIKSHFGPSAYFEDGRLNSTFLASEVFHDKKKLDLLNNLVHPNVGKDFEYWVQENGQLPYLIKEAALLFESGSYKELDKVINVDAPADIRKKRVAARDKHRIEADIQAIMDRQLGDEQRKTMADFVITNNDRDLVIPQVLALHRQFISGKGN
ncbi:dephospho-CoA kinase [Fulvivirgaceae bacterium BMA12]|uniref:Dephospho-CoA kinase n=1 Tax=Agaribacillus aureus TaxID=3051825 RepID=A0ABT8LFT5_9BACT|nr:dephospho-CoA kinase [Fulvivirgaceae bacterium BMA12]